MKTVSDLMELLGVVPFLAKPMEEKLNLILFIFFSPLSKHLDHAFRYWGTSAEIDSLVCELLSCVDKKRPMILAAPYTAPVQLGLEEW